jgi:hypothetical protein
VATEEELLAPLFDQALAGEPEPLERYLKSHSRLPGPRMNLSLAMAVGRVAGQMAARTGAGVSLESVLDRWAATPVEQAPPNDPGEILPAAAPLAYGQVAVSRPEWWDDELAKLRRSASDVRWRVRELVAAGLQTMLAADWNRTIAALRSWLPGGRPLEVRAAAAAVAEPPLLEDPTRGSDALAIQEGAVGVLAAIPPAERHTDDVRVLRQGLGYTVGVAVAAVPVPGTRLLVRMARSGDRDLAWVVRENMKKARLRRIPEVSAKVGAVMRDG